MADNTYPEPDQQSSWRLGAALGYGQRTNPLVNSDNIVVVLDLDIAWFGEHWFFDNGDLGLTLQDKENYTLNLIGRINSDRVFFSKTNTRFVSISNNVNEPMLVEAEVPDRDYAIELGVELLAEGDWGYLQAAAFHDVSGKHEGYELFAEYSYLLRKQRWVFEPSAGLSWKSQELNDYYYGVRKSESSKVFPAYEAGAGLNWQARFKVGYQLNRHWMALVVAEYEHLNSDAASSPIVDESSVYGAFAGLKYTY